MRVVMLLAVGVSLASIAGCGSSPGGGNGDADGRTAPVPSRAEPSTPAPARPSAPGAGTPASRSALPEATRSRAQRRPSTSPGADVPGGVPGGADPENPTDLAGAPMVLTGVVSRDRGCVVLVVNGRRWALVGGAADGLVDGRRTTVRGRPVAVPAVCEADHGLMLRGPAHP
jgi:hypothetical protein